jgi:ribosomal protein S18 acetylase RimI-like enzyme
MPSAIQFREATQQDDAAIARHFFQLWRDNRVPETRIQSNWLEITVQFIQQARQQLDYCAFLAESEGTIVGSAGCQRFAGLYPQVLTEQQRLYGYIWGVYVEPAYRQQGIAKALTQQTIAHLRSLHCTHAILHASPIGKPLYLGLGFIESNEMRLDLT